MENTVNEAVVAKKRAKNSSMRRNRIIVDSIVYVVLIIGSIAMVYPLLWMISASFNTQASVYSVAFLPKDWDFGNYGKVFKLLEEPTYWRALFNTALYSTVPVAFGTIVSAGAAFAFAKIDFHGKNVMFIVLLSAIMIPFPAIMIPQFAVYNLLGWLNGPLTQIVPKLFGGIMCIFFIRQFLYGLPTSIVESAKIDGASYPRIFFNMILPLAMPAIVAQFLLGFMGAWNDYLGPYLFVNKESWYPITVALAVFNNANSLQAEVPVVMAGSVLAVVPVLVLFGCFQKIIIESVMLTGSKE